MFIKLLVKNFPKHSKSKEIKEFFGGIHIKFIKIENNGAGYIEVKNEQAAEAALKKNFSLFKKHKITVKLSKENEQVKEIKKNTKEKRQQFPIVKEEILIDKIKDTGRLYLRNLNFDVNESEIVEMFKIFGDLEEVHLPYDLNLKRIKGYGYVSYLLPKDAVEAFKALDKTPLKGRKIHILPGEDKPEGQNCKGVLENETEENKNFKEEKLQKLKASANSGHNWNALFVNSDVVSQYLADKLNISKSDLFSDALKGSISVKLAQAETQLVALIQKFMTDNHIRLDVLTSIMNRGPKSKGNVNVSFALSSTTFIVKNLSPGVTKEDLEKIFNQYPGLDKILLPPYGVTAIVSYKLSQHAKVAYQNCAYMEFQDSVMMLQWAPVEIFQPNQDKEIAENNCPIIEVDIESLTMAAKKKRRREQERIEKEIKEKKQRLEEEKAEKKLKESQEKADELLKRSTKIIVKNISFQSTLKEMEELFKPFDGIVTIRMPKKSSGGHKGFAFVEFETEDHAQTVMDAMSASTHLLGRRLILLYSETA